MMNQHFEDNFSFVSYKTDPTISDLLWCERWVENHLKVLASGRSDKNWMGARSGVERRHLKIEYANHIKMLEKLKRFVY